MFALNAFSAGVAQQQRRQLAAARRATVKPVASLSAHSAGTAVKRAFNFSAGPAMLPLDVLKTAEADMISWHDSGMSVLEMSHRGPEFEGIIAKAEKDLRTLMNIPDNYKARPKIDLQFSNQLFVPKKCFSS